MALPPVRSARQLGSTLKRVRIDKKLSQTDISNETGLRQAGISLLEGGAKGVRLDTLFKILAALDLEIVVQKRSKLKTGRRS